MLAACLSEQRHADVFLKVAFFWEIPGAMRDPDSAAKDISVKSPETAAWEVRMLAAFDRLPLANGDLCDVRDLKFEMDSREVPAFFSSKGPCVPRPIDPGDSSNFVLLFACWHNVPDLFGTEARVYDGLYLVGNSKPQPIANAVPKKNRVKPEEGQFLLLLVPNATEFKADENLFTSLFGAYGKTDKPPAGTFMSPNDEEDAKAMIVRCSRPILNRKLQ
jgi:hypothetical protein